MYRNKPSFSPKKFRFGVKSQLDGRVIFGRLKTESEKIASKSASVETLGVLISISASNFTTTFNSGPKKYCVVAIKAFFSLTHSLNSARLSLIVLFIAEKGCCFLLIAASCSFVNDFD